MARRRATEFPVLDLLDEFEMRAPYVMLMLAARSGRDFLYLHNAVIPPNCRLPRELVIALKLERERLLSSGQGANDARRLNARNRPSDAFLLREFDIARRHHNGSGLESLGRYYNSLLSGHDKPGYDDHFWWERYEAAFAPYTEKWNANRILHSKLAGVAGTVWMDIKIHGTETSRRVWLRVRVQIHDQQLDYDGTEKLLTLPAWDDFNTDTMFRNIAYVLDITHVVSLPEPSLDLIYINPETRGKLLAFINVQGIRLEVSL